MSKYRNIFIADDDEDDLSFFQDAVKETCPSVELTTAEDGQVLLSKLENAPLPDVILLDLNMPFVNGKECLKVLRQNPQYNKVPILIYSTSNAKSDIEYCMNNGANYYIVKPNSYHAVKLVVTDIYNGTIESKSSNWV
jgi:CheY-like chemotaxis protein